MTFHTGLSLQKATTLLQKGYEHSITQKQLAAPTTPLRLSKREDSLVKRLINPFFFVGLVLCALPSLLWLYFMSKKIVLVVAAGTAANDPFCGYYAKEGSFFFYAEMKLVKSWLESSL